MCFNCPYCRRFVSWLLLLVIVLLCRVVCVCGVSDHMVFARAVIGCHALCLFLPCFIMLIVVVESKDNMMRVSVIFCF